MRQPERSNLRVGVYLDAPYRRDESCPGKVLTNSEGYPFLTFVCETVDRCGNLVLFGRSAPDGAAAGYPLPGRAEHVPLPFYESVARAGQLLRAFPGTVTRAWRGLGGVDVMWVFGPHPFSPVIVALARARGARVCLGVRQDTMRYFRSRLPSRYASAVLAPLWLLDGCFRILSRKLPTVVVGEHLERQYGGPRPGLLTLRPSLVRADDVVSGPRDSNTGVPIRLLTVGRIDREKDPLLLLDAFAELNRRRPGRYTFTWVGQGPLAAAVEERVRGEGLEEVVDLRGFVPFGPELLDLYRHADAFVHVAVTEAFGQVLVEAMASGTPIVATAVGGVSGALDGGAAGLLVAPGDRDALVEAILQLDDEREPTRRRVARGLELAQHFTLEDQAERVAALLRTAGGNDPGASGSGTPPC